MVMNKTELESILHYMDEDIMTMDGFDEAFIGFSRRCGQPTLATYSFEKMLQVLIDRDGMDVQEAEEYISYNCVGAWMGELTPVVMYECDEYYG